MRTEASKPRRRPLVALGAFLLLAAALFLGACGSSDDSSGGGSGGKIDVVGYSTPESVYTDGLQPAFEKTPAGKGVSFSDSFGASGDQSRAVEAGQSASLVHFSVGGDMTRLVDAGIVDANWDKNKYRGIAQESTVVFVVRKGNPEGISTFDDLISKDVSVVTPNPFSSGSARWNIMAIYGSQLAAGKSEAEALDAVRKVLEKTDAQPGSGADSLTAFTQGQEAFAEWGYRPVDQAVFKEHKADFADPKNLFTIEEVGGWDKVNAEMFDPEKGSIAKIEEEAGVSTAK